MAGQKKKVELTVQNDRLDIPEDTFRVGKRPIPKTLAIRSFLRDGDVMILSRKSSIYPRIKELRT